VKPLRVYAYKGCDTCRKALKFLAEKQVPHEVIPIREQPPTVAELRQMLGHVEGELRRLFNTSGGDYKELNLKDRLPAMTTEEALALLAGNGNLIKRPSSLATAGARWASSLRNGSDSSARDRGKIAATRASPAKVLEAWRSSTGPALLINYRDPPRKTA
jgi:arsenate reductase